MKGRGKELGKPNRRKKTIRKQNGIIVYLLNPVQSVLPYKYYTSNIYYVASTNFSKAVSKSFLSLVLLLREHHPLHFAAD